MFRVVFYASEYIPSQKTSNPESLVEELIQNFVAKGMWVEPPLFPGYPAEYRVYKGGRRVSSFTIKEIDDEY